MVRASTLSWFYDGVGGTFDYWPDGIDGPMLSERPPFGNVALVQIRTGYTTASVPLEMTMRNCRKCQPQQRSGRMAEATGPS